MKFRVYQLSKISEIWHGVDDFWVQVHCEIEAVGEPGGEAVSIEIVSPKFLERLEGLQFGRGLVIVNDFDLPEVELRLQKLLDGFGANSWSELYDKMSQYFDWL